MSSKSAIDKQRIRLRPLRRADSALLYEWINDRELVLLNSPFAPVSAADHERWIESMLAARADIVFFIIELNDGTVIGSCRLGAIDARSKTAELQIRIGKREFHGKGFGTEAIEALVSVGFDDLDLHRIYLHVFATNLPDSRRKASCATRSTSMTAGWMSS
jgi:RimJ/RimL family protein N-acetyltransferase